MTWLQIALVSTALMAVLIYFGGKRISPRVMRNIAGGLGVIAGLCWQNALGFGDAGLVVKLGFIVAGYLAALGLMRVRGVKN